MKVPHDPNELIAVVDENDNIIGKYPRKNHAGGRPHREASVLIVNPKNEILVQERADDGKLDYSASGHFPYKEDYLEGAVREVEEEIGIKINNSKFVKISKRRAKYFGDYVNDRFITLFEVRGDYRIEDIQIDPAEVKSVRYYSAEELRRVMKAEPKRISQGFAESLEIYFETRGI